MTRKDSEQTDDEREPTDPIETGADQDEDEEADEAAEADAEAEDAADADPDPEGENGEDGEDGEADEDSKFGKGAQKRIKGLLGENKSLKAAIDSMKGELENAKKLAGDDGRAMLSAAEKAGILPGLMSRDEAEAFQSLEELPNIIGSYQDWLDDHERDDTLTVGEKTMSYGDVRKRVRKLAERLDGLKETYGDRRKELRAKVKEIFETGVAALKEGWKPGAKAPEPKKGKKIETKPKAKAGLTHTRKAVENDIEVENEDDLEAYIMADRRRKK